MNRILAILVAVSCALGAGAALVEFGTDGISTGDNLDNISVSGTEVSVAEILNLNVTATFDEGIIENVNTVADRLGLNSGLVNEGTSYFDTGEWIGFSFDKNVNVTLFKFTDFTDGDSVKITWNTTVLTLTDTDLNGYNEYSVDWTISADDTIRFDALGKSTPDSTTGGFGLERMDLSVVPEPATLALIGIGGLLALVSRRIKNR